jgi:hypothetical protein
MSTTVLRSLEKPTLYFIAFIAIAVLVVFCVMRRVRARAGAAGEQIDYGREAIEENVREGARLLWSYALSYRGFLIVAVSAVGFVVGVLILVAYCLALDWEKTVSFAGSVVTIAAAAATVASILNTAAILRNQKSFLTSYDGLLDRVNDGLNVLVRKAARKENRVKIRMCSPTPAIGNISADTKLFRQFLGHLNELIKSDRLDLQVCMRSDFSTWQQGFIRRRFGVIREAFGTFSERSESKRTVERALDVLQRDFDSRWWDDLREPVGSDAAMAAADVYHMKVDLDFVRSWLEGAVKSANGRQVTDDEETITAQRLQVLEHAAHTNADLQVVGMLRSFTPTEDIRLVTGDQAVFPPCIALSLEELDCVCWIRPSWSGMRNELTGTYSITGPGGRVVEQLLLHYGVPFGELRPPADASAQSINVTDFLSLWEKDTSTQLRAVEDNDTEPCQLLTQDLWGKIPGLRYRRSMPVSVIQKCLRSIAS